MKKSNRDPDEHIAEIDEMFREDIVLLDAEIRQRMPERRRVLYEGKFWGGTDQNIIGYGDVTYTGSNGKEVEWFIVGLAAQKKHISVYINASDGDGYLIAKYADRLGKAKVGSAAVTLKSVAAIDLDVLMEVVSRANSMFP